MKESKIDRVKDLVQKNGGWTAVFNKYSCLSQALEIVQKGSQAQVACPFSGKGTTKFRFIGDRNAYVTKGNAWHEDFGMMDGISIVAELERCTVGEALNVISDALGGLSTESMSRRVTPVVPVAYELTEQEKAERNKWLSALASGCMPASQSPIVAQYMKNRGLKGEVGLLPNPLYFNPSILHVDGEKNKTWWPSIVAAVTDENYDVVSFHRHYITKDGKKAPVDNAKKMMPPNNKITGCSIKLDQPAYLDGVGLIGVCEGLETALAVREATGMPMWSGIDAGKMKAMHIPEDIKMVIIWGDHDKSLTGDKKSLELKARLEKEVPGRIVEIHIPDELTIPTNSKSIDWLDVYVHLGAEYFPLRMDAEDTAVKTGVDLVD